MEGINKERGRRKDWRWRKRGERCFRKRRKNNLNSIEDSLLFVSDMSIWYLISIRQPTDICSEGGINLQSICLWGDLEAHQGSLLYKVRRPYPILDLSSGVCWPGILWTGWGALLIGMLSVQWSSSSSSLISQQQEHVGSASLHFRLNRNLYGFLSILPTTNVPILFNNPHWLWEEEKNI